MFCYAVVRDMKDLYSVCLLTSIVGASGVASYIYTEQP